MFKSIVITFFMSVMSFSNHASVNVKNEYKEFKKAADAKVIKIEKKLQKIGNKVSSLSGEAKEEMKDKYDDLLEMKDSLKERLADAGDATSETWDTVKDRVEDYADALESRVDEAIN